MTGVIHGGASEQERARAQANGRPLVDLSASLNPYGPHPAVVAAAREAPIARYPEVDAASFSRAYAASVGVPADSVIAGNGSSELIYLAARAFACGRHRALILGPTFGEYERAVLAAGLVCEALEARPPGFAPAVDAAVAALGAGAPALLFLCNPNNPTGALVSPADILRLTAAALAAGGKVVVDEAYLPFVACSAPLRPAPGLLLIRSLTKLHAIPGLRLGVAVGEPADIAGVRALQPPWSVSAPALAAGMAALGEERFVLDSLRRIGATRDGLLRALAALGFAPPKAAANFVLLDVGDAAVFRARLLEHGFTVRDCASFGLPAFVRIAVPHERELPALISAIEACR